MAVKVAINGFGRIGRAVYKNLIRRGDAAGVEVVAINDLTDAATLAYLLKYDSVHGRFEGEVGARDGHLEVDGRSVQVTSEREPAKLPWRDLGVQVVVESTGRFLTRALAQLHLDAGAERVILTAPSKDPDITVVLGVNEERITPAHRVISNASCTTNCVTPLAKVLLDNVGFVHGLMTTIHSYTQDQALLDAPHKDRRRGRSAALSMVPTTTGAARATALVLPQLKGKIDGMAIRVPTPNVSLVDLTVEVERPTSVDEVNGALKAAAEGALKGILAYSDEQLVSIDFNESPFSSIADGTCTIVIDGRMVKVLAWYDNEYGYSARVADLVAYVGKAA
ncbi:MAG: type I glyceraldehyde-3-phosphate dehydrogenase [Gemmatimonadetes bacterium]|nr:type I glyceraldehyde-3-phosphate dehydrogenase [Gemmatimonadota bacterium]